MLSKRFVNVSFFMFLLFVIAPVFVNLNFSGGVRFDAGPFNNLGFPSVPLSFFAAVVLLVFTLFQLRFPSGFICLVLLLSIYLCMNFTFANSIRPFVLFVGMILPFLNYISMKSLLSRFSVKFSPAVFFYDTLSAIILIKFLTDVFLYDEIFSKYFIFKKFVIYSYYDYFPFLYVFTILLSLNMFVSGVRRKTCLIVFVVSVIGVCFCFSRTFFFLGLSSPFVFCFFRFFRLSAKLVAFFSIFIVVFLTVVVGCFGDEYLKLMDVSLFERGSHWVSFFHSFTIRDIFFPFLNEYRNFLQDGSFHNEILEIFSYFSFVLVIYIYQIFKIFDSVDRNYSVVSFSVLFFLIVGSLIQLNITNIYLGLIWSSFLACSSMNTACKED